MKNLAFLFLLLITFDAIGQKNKALKPFQSLSISTNIDATLIQSDVFKMEITMVKGSEEGLRIIEDDGELNVSTKSKGMFSGNNIKAKVVIYCRDLNEIEVSAGAKLESKDVLDFNTLDLEVSSGAMAILELNNSECDAEVSSGGSIVLKGKGKKFESDASSGGSINAEDFQTEDGEADVSSGGSITIWSTKSLDVDASSGGSVKYKGEPKLTEIDKGMSGSVSKM